MPILIRLCVCDLPSPNINLLFYLILHVFSFPYFRFFPLCSLTWKARGHQPQGENTACREQIVIFDLEAFSLCVSLVLQYSPQKYIRQGSQGKDTREREI